MFEFLVRKTTTCKDDLLSGLTVALALVPEAVAFSFVAGVDPLVGLYAAFMVGLITAAIGGRPGMISGATGALGATLPRNQRAVQCSHRRHLRRLPLRIFPRRVRSAAGETWRRPGRGLL